MNSFFFCFPVFISIQNHLLRELLSSIKLCEPTLEELFCSSDTWAADSFQQEEPALSATRVPCCTLGGATGPSKPASSQFLWVWVPQWPGCSPEYQALHQHSQLTWVYFFPFTGLCSSLGHVECDSLPGPTFQHFDSNSLARWHLVNPKSRGLHHLPKSAVTQSFAWRGEKAFDKWESLRVSCPSGRDFPVSQAM